jgi:hypothetical protein
VLPIRATRAAVVRDCLLKKVFGYKEDDLTGEWNKQHDFELHEFYSSPHHHPHFYSVNQPRLGG